MSRSNPTVTTPARKFFKWRGSTGDLVWYDREREEEIEVKRPFSFVVLDQLTTIKGYNNELKTGIWSNEIRNLRDEPLYVKMKNSLLASGLYDAIKNDVKAKGGKYARSVYIAYQEPSQDSFEWVIGNINLTGAALGEWFEFTRGVNVESAGIGVTLKGKKEETNGATKFFIPTFEVTRSFAEQEDVFVELDTELQDYLKSYLAQRPDNDAYDGVDSDPEDYSQDIERLKEAGRERARDVVDTDIDRPIDLSEIPF